MNSLQQQDETHGPAAPAAGLLPAAAADAAAADTTAAHPAAAGHPDPAAGLAVVRSALDAASLAQAELEQVSALQAQVRQFMDHVKVSPDKLTLHESFGQLDGFARRTDDPANSPLVGLQLSFVFKHNVEIIPKVSRHPLVHVYKHYQKTANPKSLKQKSGSFDAFVFAVNKMTLTMKYSLLPTSFAGDIQEFLKEQRVAKVDDQTPHVFYMSFLPNEWQTHAIQKRCEQSRVNMLIPHAQRAEELSDAFLESVTVKGYLGPCTLLPDSVKKRIERAQVAEAKDTKRRAQEQNVTAAALESAVDQAVESTNLRYKPLSAKEKADRNVRNMIDTLSGMHEGLYGAQVSPELCRPIVEAMLRSTQVGAGGDAGRDDKLQLANFLASARMAEIEAGQAFKDLSREIDVFLRSEVIRKRFSDHSKFGDFADFAGKEYPHSKLMAPALSVFAQMDALVHGLSGLVELPPKQEPLPAGITAEALLQRVAAKGSYNLKDNPVAPPSAQQLAVGVQHVASYFNEVYNPEHPFESYAEGAKMYLECAVDPVVAPFACHDQVFDMIVRSERVHPNCEGAGKVVQKLAEAYIQDSRLGQGFGCVWEPPFELCQEFEAALQTMQSQSAKRLSRKRKAAPKK